MATKAKTVAETLTAATVATPDAGAIEAHVLALVAHLAETEQAIAHTQTTIDGTPIGQRLVGLRKEAQAIKDKLRVDMDPLKLTHDKPLTTPYGKVGWTRRVSKVLAAVAVRELAPRLADLVITETVDNKALIEVVKMCVKRNELPADTLQKIEDHVMSEEKVTWAFICEPTVKSK